MALKKKAGSNAMEEQIAALRAFNRFYTARLGLLRRRHLDGAFGLTEARLLYEIGAEPGRTAADLCAVVELDAGYVSRLLSSLVGQKLIRRGSSKADKRERLLTLTATGKRAVARLNAQSSEQMEQLLKGLPSREREELVECLRRVRTVLDARPRDAVRIVPVRTVNEEVLAIVHEYYEAVNVVQRDDAKSLQKAIRGELSGMWLAYLGADAVGCVVLRKLAKPARAAECKRLYVRPAARGRRIADMLLDAQEEFAREQGVDWIYLDSYEDLQAAIRVYERRGYERCARYNDNPQATVFMRKYVGSGSSSG